MQNGYLWKNRTDSRKVVLPIKNEKKSILIKETIIHGLFLVYIGVLLRITVFRSGFRWGDLCENGTINLTLFKSYIPLLENGDIKRIIYLFVGNIIWFVPLGFYLRRFTGRKRAVWQIFLAGLLFSFIIEFLQYVFGTGVSELDDLILNSLGAWIGAVLGTKRGK